MAAKTSIEWAASADGTPGATWNPLRAIDTETGRRGTFCVHASAGCVNCYAETFQARTLPGNGIGLAYTAQNLPRVKFYLDEKMLTAPMRRARPTTYFLSSMTDVFGEFVDPAFVDRLFAVMALCTKHTFIVVTKRSAWMRAYFEAIAREQMLRDEMETLCPSRFDGIACELTASPWAAGAIEDRQWPLRNVILMVSCEDQANAEERIPDLLATPAAARGVSLEPLLGPILLDAWAERIGPSAWRSKIDWAIVGGESGPNARPMHPRWAESLRDQCAAAGIPFFFKQWGGWKPICAMADGEDDCLYHPAPEMHPDASRRCKVGQSILHDDGSIHSITAPGAYLAGTNSMLTFKVGKGRAGRLLDGREWSERPSLLQPTEQPANVD